MNDEIRVKFTESKLAYLYKDGKLIYPQQWTTKPPTQDGWYWARDFDGETSPVLVSISGGHIVMTGWNADYDGDRTKTSAEFTHWLGPIPEPESPTEKEK